MLPTRSVRISDGDWDNMKALAEIEQRSISWIIQQAVKEYLRRRAPGGADSRQPDA